MKTNFLLIFIDTFLLLCPKIESKAYSFLTLNSFFNFLGELCGGEAPNRNKEIKVLKNNSLIKGGTLIWASKANRLE